MLSSDSRNRYDSKTQSKFRELLRESLEPKKLITPELRADHAEYLATWLHVLKNDKRAIFTAASYASKAVEFMHGMQPTSDAKIFGAIAATEATSSRSSAFLVPIVCAFTSEFR